MKLLVENAVFDYQSGKESNASEFTNLYICESKFIGTRGPLELYQRRARRNWKLRSSLDNKPLATKIRIGDKSDIDTIERENLFHNNKTDEDNNDIKSVNLTDG